MAEAEEIQWLRSQLKEREEQVHQAAQAGLDLLNQQMELQNRLEEQRVEMTNALEVCHCTQKGSADPNHSFALRIFMYHQYIRETSIVNFAASLMQTSL